MNDGRLRLDLHDLAGEVDNVDLRDRVLHTSRRLGLQRAMTASAAAVVVLAGAVGIAFAVAPDLAPPVPATSSSASPPAPSNVQTPSRAPSETEKVIAGTRWYLGHTKSEYVIHAVTGGQDTVKAHIPGADGSCVAQTVTVSPGGRRLAWVEGSDDVNGTLKVAALDGTHQQSITTGVV
jgi:hypothetical protein